MPEPSVGVLWGLIILSLVLLILSSIIIISLLLYGRRVKEHEKRFKLLFDKIHDSLLILDDKGVIIQTNDAGRRLTGYAIQELIGSPLAGLMSDSEYGIISFEIEKMLKSGSEFMGEFTIHDKAHNSLQVEIVGGPLKLEHKNLVLLSLRDLTYRHQIENELRQKNAALKEIMANIEEDRLRFKMQIAETIDQVLIPTVKKAMNADGNNGDHLRLLEQNLQEMSMASGGLLRQYAKLSPREIEICNLIRNGATSKQIASSLNISELTVRKHREKIRKKLALNKKEINLNSFLNTNNKED